MFSSQYPELDHLTVSGDTPVDRRLRIHERGEAVVLSCACVFATQSDWSLTYGYAVLTSAPALYVGRAMQHLTWKWGRKPEAPAESGTAAAGPSEQPMGTLRLTNVGHGWLYIEEETQRGPRVFIVKPGSPSSPQEWIRVFQQLKSVPVAVGRCDRPYMLLAAQFPPDRAILPQLPFREEDDGTAAAAEAAAPAAAEGRETRMGTLLRDRIVWLESTPEPTDVFITAQTMLPEYRLLRCVSVQDAIQEFVRGSTFCFVCDATMADTCGREIAGRTPATPIFAVCVPFRQLTVECIPSVTAIQAASPIEAAQMLLERLRVRRDGVARPLRRRVMVMQIGDQTVRTGMAGAAQPESCIRNQAEHQRHYGGLEVSSSYRAQDWRVHTNVQELGSITGRAEAAAVFSVATGQTRGDLQKGSGTPVWSRAEALLVTEPAHGARDLKQLKLALASATQEPQGRPAEQIFYGGEPLNDIDKTLADLGIGPECTAELVVRADGDCAPRGINMARLAGAEGDVTIFVRTPEGGNLAVDVPMDGLVSDLLDRALVQWRGHSRSMKCLLYPVAKEVLALYAYGHASGIVLSVGGTYARAVPVLNGTPVVEAVQTSSISSGILQEKMLWQMVNGNSKLFKAGQWYRLEGFVVDQLPKVRDSACRVLSKDHIAEVRRWVDSLPPQGSQAQGAPAGAAGAATKSSGRKTPPKKETSRSWFADAMRSVRGPSKEDKAAAAKLAVEQLAERHAYVHGMAKLAAADGREVPDVFSWRELGKGPRGQGVFRMGTEGWAVPEMLIDPAFETVVGAPKKPEGCQSSGTKLRAVGMPDLIRNCVRKCEEIFQQAPLGQSQLRQVCSAVVLDGAGTQWPGFVERLQEELWPKSIDDTPVWAVGDVPLCREDSARVERAYRKYMFPRVEPGQTEPPPPEPFLLVPVTTDEAQGLLLDFKTRSATSRRSGAQLPLTRRDPPSAHALQPCAAFSSLPQSVVFKVLSYLDPLTLYNPLHEVEACEERESVAWRGGSLLGVNYHSEIIEAAAQGVDTRRGIEPLLFRARPV
eukprot:TRINITY_DN94_c0_g1_i1.p1 TRINITY_DN94_c0_g1~~TRINITY_DN94_c0_g1_i1.p1  ORF type:complete len:1044 (+),score=242.65 TRINITY_DN94_c0_g1_i1:68-3199(+)